MVSKFYDFYGQAESKEVLLARIKDWISSLPDARDFTCHVMLNLADKSIRELFEVVRDYGEEISK